MASYQDARTRLFAKLDNMKTGDILEVAHEANGRPDLYIQICKDYIDSGHPEIEFNSNYSKVPKLRWW